MYSENVNARRSCITDSSTTVKIDLILLYREKIYCVTHICLNQGYVEVVEYFCFRFQLRTKLVAWVYFRFQLLSSKMLPLSQKFNRFHIPVPCFMKNASASGSLKSQMLPSLLPASFFKLLPLPFQNNLTASTSLV